MSSSSQRQLTETFEQLRFILNFTEAALEYGGQELDTEWQAAIDLHGRCREIRHHRRHIVEGVLLKGVGTFEYSLREAVSDAVDDLTERCIRFSQLDKPLYDAYLAKLLDACAKPKRYGYEREVVSKFLVDILQPDIEHRPLEISTDLLTRTENNLRAEELQNLVRIINVTDLWKQISEQAEIRLLCEEKDPGPTQKKIRSLLDKIMEERNQIIHPSTSSHTVTIEAVQKYLDILEAIADSVNKIISMHVSYSLTSTS